MKKILLLLLSLFLGLSSQAQEDSLQANRYVMRATLYGAGFTNILDTYLSPMEYTGIIQTVYCATTYKHR